MAVTANFITSLSQYLQTLCKGCVDFSSEIELIGYINIRIDSGNKVDCVLSEKVLKCNSVTNSFENSSASKSFLAKRCERELEKDPTVEVGSSPSLNYKQQNPCVYSQQSAAKQTCASLEKVKDATTFPPQKRRRKRKHSRSQLSVENDSIEQLLNAHVSGASISTSSSILAGDQTDLKESTNCLTDMNVKAEPFDSEDSEGNQSDDFSDADRTSEEVSIVSLVKNEVSGLNISATPTETLPARDSEVDTTKPCSSYKELDRNSQSCFSDTKNESSIEQSASQKAVFSGSDAGTRFSLATIVPNDGACSKRSKKKSNAQYRKRLKEDSVRMEHIQETLVRFAGLPPADNPLAPCHPTAYPPPGYPPATYHSTAYFPPGFSQATYHPTAYPPPGFSQAVAAPPPSAPQDNAPLPPSPATIAAPLPPAPQDNEPLPPPPATVAAPPPPRTYGVTTNRLFYENYVYSMKTNRAETHNKKYWKCIHKRGKSCNATCISDGKNDNIILCTPHNHPPSTMNQINQQKQQIVHSLKIKALQSNDAPSAVTRAVVGACSDELLSVLPTKDSCRRLVAKQRPAPSGPKDIHFEMPSFRKMLDSFFSPKPNQESV